MGKIANEIAQEKTNRIKNISNMLNYDIGSTRNRIIAEAVKISIDFRTNVSPFPNRDNNKAVSPPIFSKKPQSLGGVQEVLGHVIAGHNSAPKLNNFSSKLRQELALNGNILHKHGAKNPENAKGEAHPPLAKNVNSQNLGKKNNMLPH